MASHGLGEGPNDGGAPQFVSLLACFEELIVECLSKRSTFISAQRDCGGSVVVKVPPHAAKAWIRGMLSAHSQLQAQDDATLVEYLKVYIHCHAGVACALCYSAPVVTRAQQAANMSAYPSFCSSNTFYLHTG